MFLGINGHPFGDAAYLATPATKQVAMLKSMNMNWYRINVLTTSDGTISAFSSSLFASLQEAAASGKVNLLPMLYTRTLSLNDNAADAYKKGKVLGGNFAAKYGQYFTYYNLGNDLELDLLNKHTTGREVSNYDAAKSSITAAYLKGMDEGIKLNDPGAKTIIDAGWLHWGFLTICKNNDVNFDAVGYHWYSDMEGPAARAPYNISDITVTLANNFPDKEIWFTEYGYRYKALSLKNEADQNEFMTKFVEKCKNNPRVKVAIAYELFDEPYKGSHEGNYGFMKWTNLFTVSLKKLVAQSFSKSILDPPTDTATNTPSTPIDTELVTNITGNSGSKFQASKLKVESTYYTDRVYKIKSLPTYLANSTLIKTTNDDKFNKQEGYISFKLARPATVYIAYDSRATKIPAWLKEYTKVTDKLGIDDPKVSKLNLYKKDFENGTVALDGNSSGSANGAFCHYVLIIKENK
ncbi:hypothetical protein A0256_14360 [Mucilaginibacter sp. PAMC 26640]|nr:hypothetical protein A0256_14360 [Mucilaginibacter sp. PAMC 26640]